MTDPLGEFEDQVARLVVEAGRSLGAAPPPALETPPGGLADLAFACFALAKSQRRPPQEIAADVAARIQPQLGQAPLVSRCEANQGYVNFWVRRDEVARRVLPAVLREKAAFGSLPRRGKRLLLEHTSANPNGPLHVGRARNPIIGDTLVRIFRKAGWDTEAQYYVDDVGKQVAILAWGVSHLKEADLPPAENPKADHQRVRFYQETNRRLEQSPSAAAAIQDLIVRSEEAQSTVLREFEAAYQPVLEGMLQSLRQIGVTFGSFKKESDFVADGSTKRVIERLQAAPESRQDDDGGLFLDLSGRGIHGKTQRFVYRRRDGTSLYATRDVAYHLWKAEGADRLVNVLGEDHRLQATQVRVCLELLGCRVLPEVVFYSFVSLPEGKMSTRRGRVVFLDDLIAEAVDRAYDEVQKRRGDELGEAQMRNIARAVGVGALRYNIVRVQAEKAIAFKWEEALNFEGASAPFIQYAYARCASILRKARDQGLVPPAPEGAAPGPHAAELELLLRVARLPRVVDEAARTVRPHVVATYAQELAGALSAFYRDCPVLAAQTPALATSRLAEVEAAWIALGTTLDLLGVPALEEM